MACILCKGKHDLLAAFHFDSDGSPKRSALHHLYKAEHLVWPLVGVVPFTLGHFVLGLKMLTPKLCNLKTALIDVIQLDLFLLLFQNSTNESYNLLC